MKYAAFLRGVNVGGRVIKSADLKTCFEKTGYKNVSTIIQSGNVVFESDKPALELKDEIEQLLTKTFDYPAKVQIVPLAGLKKIINDYPFGKAGPAKAWFTGGSIKARP